MVFSKVCALALSVLCFSMLIESNNAVKCYQCTSAGNPKCAELDASIQPTECFANQATNVMNSVLKPFGGGNAESPMNCHKLVLSNGTNNTIIRSCWFKDASCDDYKKGQTGVSYCGSCDTDGCNGATSGQLWLPAMIVAPIYFAYKALF